MFPNLSPHFSPETILMKFLYLLCCSTQWSLLCPDNTLLSGVFDTTAHHHSLPCAFLIWPGPHPVSFTLTSHSFLDSFKDSSFFFFSPEEAQDLFLFYFLSTFIPLIIFSRFKTLNIIYMLRTSDLYLWVRPLFCTPDLYSQYLTLQLHLDIIS